MPRPNSVTEVVALVRQTRVVDDARLAGFLSLFDDTGMTVATCDTPSPVAGGGCRLTPSGVFGLMVEEELLTPYQAAELAAGRGGLWAGSYLLLEPIGRGGMGQVFLAEHALLRKRAAVKVLSAALRDDAAARTRFAHEARAAAAVNHPNVVRVLDVDVTHDPPYLVMEYVDGVSLQAAVARHGTFAAAEAAAVGRQVAAGLQVAAGVGLVHRDIKPANILIDRKGGVKILDLGIARFEGDPVSRKLNAAVVLGTLDYLAPEQAIDSSAVDTRADLYGLGATLYFLLAGHPPFPDPDLGRKMALKQSADPAPVHALRPDVPAGLSAVVGRLLARKPADRYQTPAEAAAALEPWAAPGDDFPDRLFRARPAVAGAEPGPPTEPGRDHDPTPVPPTRRVLHTQTERKLPAADTTPSPVSSAPRAPARQFMCGASQDEDGGATVNLLAERQGLLSWFRCPKRRAVAVVLLVVALLVLVLSW